MMLASLKRIFLFLACILHAYGVEPEAKPVVTNLADCYRWVEHQCAIYKRLRRHAVDSAAASMQSRSMSTAFAGIGGAENAQCALYHGLRRFTGADMSAPMNLWACESFIEPNAPVRAGTKCWP